MKFHYSRHMPPNLFIEWATFLFIWRPIQSLLTHPFLIYSFLRRVRYYPPLNLITKILYEVKLLNLYSLIYIQIDTYPFIHMSWGLGTFPFLSGHIGSLLNTEAEEARWYVGEMICSSPRIEVAEEGRTGSQVACNGPTRKKIIRSWSRRQGE